MNITPGPTVQYYTTRTAVRSTVEAICSSLATGQRKTQHNRKQRDRGVGVGVERDGSAWRDEAEVLVACFTRVVILQKLYIDVL